MISKIFLTLPLLLVSCAGSSDENKPGSDSERDVMARKLITLQQSYDLLDENGDGFLSRSEISKGLEREEFEGITKDSIPLIFEFYDSNDDDLISLDEINAGFKTGPDEALRLKKAAAGKPRMES